jgi:molecular chaperone GrpE (heat shock protein)
MLFVNSMPTLLANNKLSPHRQNSLQNQYKTKTNGESHGGVRRDKYANSRVREASHQPVMDFDSPRTPSSNTAIPRTKKHSKKRRLSQMATWMEDPIVSQVERKARKRDVSKSAALREIVLIGLQHDPDVDEALERESLRESHSRDIRMLAARLARLYVELLFDVGHIKALANNILGMQKGMTEQMHKEILQDADRQTKRSLKRTNPELAPFIDAIERWLAQGEEEESAPKGATNGKHGKGGGSV